MKIFVLGLFLAALVTICMAEVSTKCTEKSQCAADECCQIINFVIATKKRQLLPGLSRPNTSGTCEKYRQEGVSCNSFDVMNGFCGCADGLTCKTVHVSTTPSPIIHIMSPRKMAPGYRSFCSGN
ncbi:uncharacterized protein [Littorina saxatilis]|uniref:Uncharacterized protein n=1 Tax=Littorina saxatilis TaxID=31220 RepID=A0AAN9GMX9_9CAEN